MVGCGEWCCYSYECGHICCSECGESAVFPRCTECGTTNVLGSAKCPGPVGKKCGTDLTSQPRNCVRYVDQWGPVSAACGLNGEKILNPTFFAVFCQQCFESGSLDRPHKEYLKIDMDGSHIRDVPLPVDPEKLMVGLQEEAIKWKACLEYCGVDIGAEAMPSGADADDPAKWREFIFHNSGQEGLMLVLVSQQQKVVQEGEDVTDAIICCELEVGDEYVIPWPCGCAFGMDNFEQLLKSYITEPENWKCPMCL